MKETEKNQQQHHRGSHSHPHPHPREHHHPHPHPPQGLRASIINWRESDLPFLQKLRVAAANEWIKIRKRQRCCDHPGEPGC